MTDMYRKWLFIAITFLMFVANATVYGDWVAAYRNFDWGIATLLCAIILGSYVVSVLFTWVNPTLFGFKFGNIRNTHRADENSPKKRLPEFSLPRVRVGLPGTDVRYISILMYLGLMTNLPIGTRVEEIIFRAGTINWPDALYRSVLFGLVHMLFGFPLIGGIILTCLGMILSYFYFQGGIPLSSQVHFQYDAMLIGYALVLAIVSSIKPLMKR